MRKMTVRFQRRRRQIVKSALVAFAVFLMAVAAAGCEYGPSAASSAASGEDSGAASGEDSGAASGEDSSEGSAAASSEDSDTSAADQTVSIENPGDEGIDFNNAQNVALLHAEPLDLVTWTVEPVMGAGELVAEGILAENARLFDPLQGEGSAFSVFYIGHEEAMVELLPDGVYWNTYSTVAPTELELSGSEFKIRAYSPLFMDAGGGDLEIRVYGYDGEGNEALLSKQTMGGQ